MGPTDTKVPSAPVIHEGTAEERYARREGDADVAYFQQLRNGGLTRPEALKLTRERVWARMSRGG